MAVSQKTRPDAYQIPSVHIALFVTRPTSLYIKIIKALARLGRDN